MLEIQHQNQFFIFNTTTPHHHQLDFFDVEYWQQQGRILGTAKGRGTTWFIQSQDVFHCNSALRHYYRGGLWGKCNKDRYMFNSLEKTRSFAEFYLLKQLHQAGLNVPKPIGAKIEKGIFNTYRADILIEKIENARDLTTFLQHQTLSSQGWLRIGNLIRQLHDLQICHTDLNAHNILLQHIHQKDETFWLIDFDKCGEKSGQSWKKENLQRLHRSFLKETTRMNIQFQEQNWQDLLTGYHAS